jgi:8-oxo-dGTP pyrophosphatase MutT (NUDIX family)
MINPTEYIFCVDENNNPIEPELKTYAHENGIWHRNSHIWVHDGQGKILCHQRSALVSVNPLRWEPFFGGHNAPSATPLETAVTELHEETGLAVSSEELKFIQLYEYFHGREFISVYLYEFLGRMEELIVEEEEVLSLKWYDIDSLRKVYSSKDPAWSHLGYEEIALDSINSVIR